MKFFLRERTVSVMIHFWLWKQRPILPERYQKAVCQLFQLSFSLVFLVQIRFHANCTVSYFDGHIAD